MEGFLAENNKPDSTELPTKYSDQIDLTLKLSPCGQDAEEKWVTRIWSSSSMSEERDNSSSVAINEGAFVLMRFGDLQKMRRVRTGKRLLLEKRRRAEAGKSKLNTVTNPSGDSWHQGGASSNNILKTWPEQENNSMVSPNAMVKEILPLASRPSDTTKLGNEGPATKKIKHVNPSCVSKGKGDDVVMEEIVRQMPRVSTTGDGPNGKRIEGLLYNYSGEGDQVSILCVCHGTFLSPSEFVMHAGGNKQVANPMKLITLCSDHYSFSYQRI